LYAAIGLGLAQEGGPVPAGLPRRCSRRRGPRVRWPEAGGWVALPRASSRQPPSRNPGAGYTIPYGASVRSVSVARGLRWHIGAAIVLLPRCPRSDSSQETPIMSLATRSIRPGLARGRVPFLAATLLAAGAAATTGAPVLGQEIREGDVTSS